VATNTTRQGANFELAIMHYLAGTMPEKWGPGFGYDCLRSSGSRGAIDVIAIGPKPWYEMDYRVNGIHPDILFIQAKRNKPYLSPADRMRVQNLALRAGALPLLSFMAKDETTGLVRPHFRILNGPGPNDWAPWEPGKDDW
jgi:hypothetical protein